MFNKDYLLLSTQTALLGHISASLRAVTIDFDEDKRLITLYFFYDAEINDQLFELASCTATEIDLDPNDRLFYDINSDFAVSLRYPQTIPLTGTLVFLRKEPNQQEYTGNRRSISLNEKYPLSSLLLCTQQALLGKITPNLRTVGLNLNLDNKKIDFYFRYDGAIDKKEYAFATSVMQEACDAFPGYSIVQHVERIDSPNGVLDQLERLAYLRYEGQYEKDY